jgi:hypothetical protein
MSIVSAVLLAMNIYFLNSETVTFQEESVTICTAFLGEILVTRIGLIFTHINDVMFLWIINEFA